MAKCKIDGSDRPKKRISAQLIRETKSEIPASIEYLGDPKRFIAIILRAIDQKRLTFNGTANSEQTIRYLATVIDVISPKTGKVLKIETLVSYAKKIHAGEIEGCKEGEFDWLG